VAITLSLGAWISTDLETLITEGSRNEKKRNIMPNTAMAITACFNKRMNML
jgi:hypothetical protein